MLIRFRNLRQRRACALRLRVMLVIAPLTIAILTAVLVYASSHCPASSDGDDVCAPRFD